MVKRPVYFLVDDDEDDHELFVYALGQIDPSIECVTALNGQQALEMLGEGDLHPDYIFLDLNMPLMGGKEFLLLMKENKALSEIPVVIFSTSSDPKDKRETAELGAVDFITKPAKISELIMLLNAFIGPYSEKH